MPIRLLLVDSQTLLREGVKAVLRSEKDVEIVGEAANGAEAIDKAAALSPDVVLIETSPPARGGVAAIRGIKKRCPHTRILVLTSDANLESFGQTAAAGAIGYIMKDISSDNLVKAVRAAYRSQTILSPTIAHQIVEQLSLGNANSAMHGSHIINEHRSPQLTQNEIAVVSRVAQGLSDKEIAAQLFLSEAAVKTRLRHVYRRFGLKNRAQAAIFALERGLLKVDAAR